MPARVEPTPPLPGLSPVMGKPLIARFNGGQLSSDAGVLALRTVEQRLGIAERLAACIDDPRLAERVRHEVADSLRHDPAFKLALGSLPGGDALCSQPTSSRTENLPGTRSLLRVGRAMVELYCSSFRQVPRRITLDIDGTFDAVHGCQR